MRPGFTAKKLHEGYDDPETGFLGISPEIRKTLTGIPIEMQRGDVLCFTEMTPHAALPNLSDTIRWSIDLRFENTARATPLGAKLSFVARSERDPSSVTTCEQWLARWEEHGALAY